MKYEAEQNIGDLWQSPGSGPYFHWGLMRLKDLTFLASLGESGVSPLIFSSREKASSFRGNSSEAKFREAFGISPSDVGIREIADGEVVSAKHPLSQRKVMFEHIHVVKTRR